MPKTQTKINKVQIKNFQLNRFLAKHKLVNLLPKSSFSQAFFAKKFCSWIFCTDVVCKILHQVKEINNKLTDLRKVFAKKNCKTILKKYKQTYKEIDF